MATWITHLRVAERILHYYDFSMKEFLAGNIAPDSGVHNENGTSCNPPKKVTHWMFKDNNGKNQFDAEGFYKKYISEMERDDKKLSFLLGYYVHLLTDIKWLQMHRAKQLQNLNYKERLKNDPNFIHEVKQDWYGLDFEYIANKKNNVFHDKYLKIDSINDYIDYFPLGALTSKMKFIHNFYLNDAESYTPTHRYLTTKEMNNFVDIASSEIIEILCSKLYKYKKID
ncbi:zinc dependent phospholipase C family protein [Clostridiaceae bacterium M8S5]|nr:zinc dependent phospholipase C family protein [Clostridiaceae bacterium M8S5]